jgi:hypothetical protein
MKGSNKSALGFVYRAVVLEENMPPTKVYVHGSNFKIVYGSHPQARSNVADSIKGELWRHRDRLKRFDFLLAVAKGFVNPNGGTCDHRTFVRGYEIGRWQDSPTEYSMMFRQGLLVNYFRKKDTWEIEPPNLVRTPADVMSGFEEAAIIFGEELKLRRHTRDLQDYLKRFPRDW